MIEASKTTELSSQPPKRRRWAWLIGLAVVAAAVTIVLLATAPKSEPVNVWFVRATNEAGVKKLVFEGTNGTARGIELSAGVVTGAIHQAKTLAVLRPVYVWTDYGVAAAANFSMTLEAPPKEVPYCVAWEFRGSGIFPTRWRRLRIGCHDFFTAHGMPGLADRFMPTPKVHIIPSTEIKE